MELDDVLDDGKIQNNNVMREYTENWLLEEKDINKEILMRRYREDKGIHDNERT